VPGLWLAAQDGGADGEEGSGGIRSIQLDKSAFVKIAKSIGFKTPRTTTPATPELIERLNGLLVNLAPYPHAAIDKRGRKKQGCSRFICGACGYTIRTTQQWIDIGLPTCACGSEMKIAN
jgi:hypothetical protein